MSFTRKLKKLMEENPNLPVVVFREEELCEYYTDPENTYCILESNADIESSGTTDDVIGIYVNDDVEEALEIEILKNRLHELVEGTDPCPWPEDGFDSTEE